MRKTTIHVSRAFLCLVVMQLLQLGIAKAQKNPQKGKQDIPLEQAIHTVEKKFHTQFAYEHNLLAGKFTNSKALEAATVSEVLKNILYPNNLLFLYISDNAYSIIAKDSKFFEGNSTDAKGIQPEQKTATQDLQSASQQSKHAIKGKVTDENGRPLQGASVSLKGTGKNAVADAAGEYRIENIAGNTASTLVFSFVGMETKEIKVGDQAEINVSLANTSTVQEVVVVGYGTQKKSNVTGSVATIKMDDVLGDRPVSTTSSLLQGASPGLQVSITSGAPGASSSINIRGGTDYGPSTSNPATYVINSGSPLILVDNVPLNGPLNLIDPNDIETVTVLKDAGSAAIYGARSAFGVIVITTKTGKKNQKTRFDYSGNFVSTSPINLPIKATPLQQVQSWIDGGMPSGYYGGQVLATWKQLLIDYQTDPSKYPGGYLLQNGTYYQLAPTDAIHQLLGNSAHQQMHNISVSGGSDKTTFRLSFGTTNENGIIVPAANQDKYTRYNLKSFVSTEVNNWMNLQLDASYYNSMQTSPYYTNAFSDATSYPSNLALDTIAGLTGLVASPKNSILNTAPVTNRYDDIRLTGRTVLKPLKGLTITGEYTFDNLRNLITSYDEVPQTKLLGAYTYVATTLTASSNFSKTNAYTDYSAINVFATYVKSLGLHNFSLMGGFNQEQSNYEQEIVAKTLPISATLPSISTAIGTLTGTDNYTQYATRGFFGRFTYDYKSKYLVQVNGRYDGSSKFPDGHRWGFFPSGSLGWRVTEENFMANLKPYLNELKLRASFGRVGNQNISDYQYYANLSATNPYWLNNYVPVTTLSTPGIISPNFTWETVQTLDYGFDWGMLKNRLTGTFDWYKRDTKDILTTNPTPLPSTLGTTAPLQNAGALSTKGFELQINWRDKIGKVTYYIGANLYDYTTTVTKAQNASNVLSNLYVGQKLGDIWGYVTDRLYTTNDFVEGTLDANYKNGTLKPGVPRFAGQSPNPGDIMYKDFDTVGTGNGVINTGSNTLSHPGDQKIIGNNTPRYQFGINGGVSYQNFDFSFVISGVLKQDQWINNQLTFPNQYQTYGALYANETNYWTPTNTNSYYGRIYTDAANGTAQPFNQQIQTRFLLNGAFTRIKNLTLRYNFQKKLLEKAHIARLQVFYSIENPFTFDHMPQGLYPDVATQGSGPGGGVGYPFMKKCSVGLNLSF